ncbi:MAG: hypothetical protein L0Y67_03985 [Gammaproteobacteria bacterium]|nr:hypothetical protein [Gammaproteobacteria bacterium]MCI0590754.1 hypothetical protein [Gammaproteobacteria bacterium]
MFVQAWIYISTLVVASYLIKLWVHSTGSKSGARINDLTQWLWKGPGYLVILLGLYSCLALLLDMARMGQWYFFPLVVVYVFLCFVMILVYMVATDLLPERFISGNIRIDLGPRLQFVWGEKGQRTAQRPE